MKIRIKEDLEFNLVSYDSSPSNLFVEISTESTFDELEAHFSKCDNIIYILADSGEKIESLSDYTKLDGIRKNILDGNTFSISLNKMSEFEILSKQQTEINLALVEIYEGMVGNEGDS